MSNESCNDCKSALTCEILFKEVDNLKQELSNVKVEVNDLKTSTKVNEEQTKMVFKILSEIKDSIEKIANKIDDIEKRPNKLFWTVIGTIAGALVIAGLKFLN